MTFRREPDPAPSGSRPVIPSSIATLDTEGRGPLRVALLASLRFPLGPPFAGGLEAQTWHLAAGLRDLGHAVTLFAHDGPPGVAVVSPGDWTPSEAARRDLSVTPAVAVGEHHAQLSALRHLALAGEAFDVIHDNTGHHLPVALAAMLTAPLVTTLHTPPTPWIESAMHLSEADIASVVSVSHHNAAAWRPGVVVDEVIHNGVDTDTWHPTLGRRDGAVWMGRIVPEKAPHLAVLAARRAGLSLRLAGPVHDDAYFDQVLRPLLGGTITYEGHLDPADAARLVGDAAVSLATPMWDEPFGQVVVESLACGTPVAGFAVGALPELVTDLVACLVAPGDVDALADAARRAGELSAADCRRLAVEEFSRSRMLARYEATFQAQVGSARRTA